jgi:predicted transcriptional regulator
VNGFLRLACIYAKRKRQFVVGKFSLRHILFLGAKKTCSYLTEKDSFSFNQKDLEYLDRSSALSRASAENKIYTGE